MPPLLQCLAALRQQPERAGAPCSGQPCTGGRAGGGREYGGNALHAIWYERLQVHVRGSSSTATAMHFVALTRPGQRASRVRREAATLTEAMLLCRVSADVNCSNEHPAPICAVCRQTALRRFLTQPAGGLVIFSDEISMPWRHGRLSGGQDNGRRRLSLGRHRRRHAALLRPHCGLHESHDGAFEVGQALLRQC